MTFYFRNYFQRTMYGLHWKNGFVLCFLLKPTPIRRILLYTLIYSLFFFLQVHNHVTNVIRQRIVLKSVKDDKNFLSAQFRFTDTRISHSSSQSLKSVLVTSWEAIGSRSDFGMILFKRLIKIMMMIMIILCGTWTYQQWWTGHWV